jgi:HPt (histidine-containing phosphotransfer) domain-containing protein
MLDFWDPGEVESPPLVPEPPIDRAHLDRMTLGDQRLEAEVLELFARQARMLLDRMPQADRAGVAALAHTINGSARAIGAWPISRAARAVQEAAVTGDDRGPAMAALQAAVGEALVVIAELAHAS